MRCGARASRRSVRTRSDALPVSLDACKFRGSVKEAGKLEIPTSPDAITTEWLTDALRAGGTIDAASVTSFDAEIVGAGSGFLGILAKLDLHYDTAEPNAPRSIIAKFPTLDPGGREIGNLFRFYEREVR